MLNTLRSIDSGGDIDLFTVVEESIRRSKMPDSCHDELSSVAYARVILVEGRRYLESLSGLVLHTADFFRNGDDLQANVHLVEMVWGVEWFLKVIEAVGKVFDLDYGELLYDDKELQSVISDLHQTLGDMQAAHESSDGDLLPDLLEFELAPQLKKWSGIFEMIEQLVTVQKSEAI